jgi:hypothetical protein
MVCMGCRSSPQLGSIKRQRAVLWVRIEQYPVALARILRADLDNAPALALQVEAFTPRAGVENLPDFDVIVELKPPHVVCSSGGVLK